MSKKLRLENGKVKEKVGSKDFLINGLRVTSNNLITRSLHGKTIKVIIISIKNSLDSKLFSRTDTQVESKTKLTSTEIPNFYVTREIKIVVPWYSLLVIFCTKEHSCHYSKLCTMQY